jgi:N-acyl-D-amino-acid deacylase
MNMADFDLIIRGGTVHDGLGGAPRIVDIAVKDGRIAAMGDVSGSATEVISAAGLIVTPGFVDVHTHYDGQATWENRLAPSSGHGVTSVVMGNCGVGFAPCKPEQRDILVKVMEGVEDVPEVVMTEGLPWNWETFPQYLDALDARRFDVDVARPAAAFGAARVRDGRAGRRPRSPLGGRPGADAPSHHRGDPGRRAGREHLAQLLHRTKAGELAPSLFSEEDELAALAEGLKDAGKGVFQIIPRRWAMPAPNSR